MQACRPICQQQRQHGVIPPRGMQQGYGIKPHFWPFDSADNGLTDDPLNGNVYR